MIDLARALKAPFDDADWISKTLLSLVWGMLGIFFFPLLAVFTGLEIEYLRRVSRGDERVPDWSGFGRKWLEGLTVWAAGVLYFLPVLALAGVLVVPAIIAAAADGLDISGVVVAGNSCLFLLLATIYSLIVSILFQAAVANYAVRERFSALFDVAEIVRLVRGGTGYWTAWLYGILIGFGMSAVTSILGGTVIGAMLYPAAVYLGTLMTAHVLGQWARVAFGTGRA